MTNRLTIVTGYFGAPIHAKAAQLARERGVELLSLDEEIVRRDGRSIKRLVMMNGEHGYRNLEYEVLKELADSGRELVEQIYQKVDAAMIGGSTGMTQEQRENLYATMELIIANLSRYIADREE